MTKLTVFLDDMQYTEDEQQQIKSYLEGKVAFDTLTIALGNKNFYYTEDIATYYLKEGKALQDEAYTKRMIYFLAKISSEYGILRMLQEVDMALIESIYPEFYETILSKQAIVESLLDEATTRHHRNDIEDCMGTMLELLRIEDIKKYISHPKYKTEKGHYIFKRNILCMALKHALEAAYEAKDEVKMKSIVLEYLENILKDHIARDGYISLYDEVNWDEERTSLGPKVIQAFLTLVDTGDDWEEHMKLVKEALPLTDRGMYYRDCVALIEADEDFQQLYSYLKHIKSNVQDSFIERIDQIVLAIVPERYIRGRYFNGCYAYCHFKDVEHVIAEYNEGCQRSPELQSVLADYMVTYTIEHLHCNRSVHKEIIRYIGQNYGIDFLVQHFKPRGIYDKAAGLHAFKLYAKADDIEHLLAESVERAITQFAKVVGEGEEAEAEIVAYIKGDSPKVNAKKLVKKKLEEHRESSLCFVLEGDYLERAYQVVADSKNKALMAYFIEDFIVSGQAIPYQQILDCVLRNPKELKIFFKSYVECSFEVRKYDDEEGYRYKGEQYEQHIFRQGIAYLEENGVACLSLAKSFGSKQKQQTILGVYANQKHITYELEELVACLTDKSKQVYELAQNYLFEVAESVREETIALLLKEIDRHHEVSEPLSVEILCRYDVPQEMLHELYDKVQTNAAREALVSKLGISIEAIYQQADGTFDLDAYLAKVYIEPKKFPIELVNIKMPKRLDGKGAELFTKQFLLTYKDSSEESVNSEAMTLAKYFEPVSFEVFLWSVLEEFERKGSKINDKWQLLIPCIYGDKKIIQHILRCIQDYSKGSRQKLAIYMIKALGMNGDKQVLNHIEKLGRGTKFKSIRETCDEVLEMYAERLGITKETLGDSLIPQYMAKGEGIRFNYGQDILTLFITKTFELEIQKADGKVVKSLPKPTGEADEVVIKQAKEAFSALKKEIKDMARLQVGRLEDAFVEARKWQADKWEQLFIEHTFMSLLGTQVVWAIYQEHQVQQVFVVQAGPVDVEGKSVQLQSSDRVGILHPMEISDEVYRLLCEKSPKLCFEQLDRERVIPEDTAIEAYMPIAYPRKNPSTVVERLRKRGWHIGSVRDGGSFSELYKEIPKLNLGIEVTFDEHPYMGGYGYEADSTDGRVGIDKIEFYRLGKIQRGSYIYDELESHEGLRYKFSEVEQRIVNEVLLQIREAMA